MSFHYNSEGDHWFRCNKCEAVSEFTRSIPPGWLDGSQTTSFEEAIMETMRQMKFKSGHFPEYDLDDYHFCESCVRKQEIKEVFK